MSRFGGAGPDGGAGRQARPVRRPVPGTAPAAIARRTKPTAEPRRSPPAPPLPDGALDRTYSGKAYPIDGGRCRWNHPEQISGSFAVIDRRWWGHLLDNGEGRRWWVTDSAWLRSEAA